MVSMGVAMVMASISSGLYQWVCPNISSSVCRKVGCSMPMPVGAVHMVISRGKEISTTM